MYRYLTRKINGRTRAVHRMVMEQTLGRPLRRGEVVHHKNGDTHDNRPENLELLTHKEHNYHHKQKHPELKTCLVCAAIFAPAPTKRARAATCSVQCGRVLAGRLRAKLSCQQIEDILRKLAEGTLGVDLAEAYGVTPSTISLIKRGKRPPVAEAIVRANAAAPPQMRAVLEVA